MLVGPQSFEEATSLMYANSLVDICLGICRVFPTFIDGPGHQTYQSKSIVDLGFLDQINNLDLIKERGYSRSRISSRAIEAFLIQILKTGFFNGDPHLAIDSDESLIYYVFGMMGEIKSFTREILMDLFYANYEKDAKKVMKSLISLEALQPTGDIMFDKSCSTSTYRRHDSSEKICSVLFG